MSGLFGCFAHSTDECMRNVFYGTDYHYHLGSVVAGVVFLQSKNGFLREIHSISEGAQFKHLFAPDFSEIEKKSAENNRTIKIGLGIISDRDPQPLIYSSKFGNVAIATVGRIPNLNQLADELKLNFSLTLRDENKVNIAEVVLRLIETKKNLIAGINYMWSRITGSISMVMIFGDGRIIGVRDRFGVSSLALGKAPNGIRAFASETSSFANLGFTSYRFLKPGEIVEITETRENILANGCQKKCRACLFNWIYNGSPAASYEGKEVEPIRYACGEALAKRDTVQVDMVAGIPDSGTAHAVGYSNYSKLPYGRPFVKYTPTWQRSYSPENQMLRNQIAEMKLLPVPSLINGQRLLFCEDSIVRGTQLLQRINVLYSHHAKQVHIRPACPPLLFPCPYLRATRHFDELITRRTIAKMQNREVGSNDFELRLDISNFLDPDSNEYRHMIKKICNKIGATTLMYQRLEDMIKAIGLPQNQLCTYCWTGIPIDKKNLV